MAIETIRAQSILTQVQAVAKLRMVAETLNQKIDNNGALAIFKVKYVRSKPLFINLR